MLTDMKKIFYILTVALALPLLHSCADMLEEENFGNPTIESMMGNEENVVLLVGQAYADLKWVHDHWGYWGVSSLTSDECITPIRMPGEHWMDSYYWKRLHNHDWNWMGDAFKNIWNSTISGAVLCNKLLATLAENNSSMSETIYKQYVGELEVLAVFGQMGFEGDPFSFCIFGPLFFCALLSDELVKDEIRVDGLAFFCNYRSFRWK